MTVLIPITVGIIFFLNSVVKVLGELCSKWIITPFKEKCTTLIPLKATTNTTTLQIGGLTYVCILAYLYSILPLNHKQDILSLPFRNLGSSYIPLYLLLPDNLLRNFVGRVVCYQNRYLQDPYRWFLEGKKSKRFSDKRWWIVSFHIIKKKFKFSKVWIYSFLIILFH